MLQGMEVQGGGVLGRLGEKVLGWLALALLILAAVAIWRMPAETKAAVWSGVWRTGAWLAVAAALPWSARWFIARVLEVGSNWAGVALIAAFTAGDLAAAALLMTGWPSGTWAWLAALTALALAGLYNYLVTEYLAEGAP